MFSFFFAFFGVGTGSAVDNMSQPKRTMWKRSSSRRPSLAVNPSRMGSILMQKVLLGMLMQYYPGFWFHMTFQFPFKPRATTVWMPIVHRGRNSNGQFRCSLDYLIGGWWGKSSLICPKDPLHRRISRSGSTSRAQVKMSRLDRSRAKESWDETIVPTMELNFKYFMYLHVLSEVFLRTHGLWTGLYIYIYNVSMSIPYLTRVCLDIPAKDVLFAWMQSYICN